MAATKSSGEGKTKAAADQKVEPKKTKTAPEKSGTNTTAKKETSKKAAPKKAVGPKLTPPQLSLLEVISKVTEPKGYVAEKKPEQRTVDALLRHKLVKKGKKDEKTKSYYVLISQLGKKFLGTLQAPAAKA